MNSNKIILDLCGGTGSWSNPYKEAGYDVRLVTLPENDVFSYQPPENVYGILVAPVCTHFSFCRTNAKEDRDLKTAMSLVIRCLEIIWQQQYKLSSKYSKKTNLKFWALENPRGFLQQFLGTPPLEFSPYEYGDEHKKRTHIWGNFNIPKKTPIVCEKQKWDHTLMKEYRQRIPEDFKYNPGCGMTFRGVIRSITPPGFANAFFQANQ